MVDGSSSSDDWRQRIDRGDLRPTGLLLEAQTAMAAVVHRHVAGPCELDPPMMDLLIRLWLEPDHHLRGIEISRRLMIHPSRASRLIDRAEAAGLVSRCEDPQDRRAQRITYTEEGRRQIERFFPLMMSTLDHTVYAVLSRDEADVLASLLRKVRDRARLVAEDGLSTRADCDR